MKKLLLLVSLFSLVPLAPVIASNTNPRIELVGSGTNNTFSFGSTTQNSLAVRVVTDRTSDSNRDRPALKITIDGIDEIATKEIFDCYILQVGGNYFETAGSDKVLYNWRCDVSFRDKILFDSNKNRFRVTAIHLGKESFVESEFEIGSLATPPTYKVDKIQFLSDGEFRFMATTRLYNLKVPASDVKFQICIDDFGCETATSSSSGLVDYSRKITNVNYTWLRVRITVTSNAGSLNSLTDTIYREKSPTPTPSTSTNIPSSSDASSGNSIPKSELKPEPKTKLRATIKVPTSAKLGKSFPVTVSVKGTGTASCYFAVYYSTNGWASYNTTGGTASERFGVKGGTSVTRNGVMAINYKGPWGVILYCNDIKTKASLPIVVGRMIQN